MDVTDCVNFGGRRYTPAESRLLEIDRSDDLGLIPDSEHERMSKLPRRRYEIFITTRKQ